MQRVDMNGNFEIYANVFSFWMNLADVTATRFASV